MMNSRLIYCNCAKKSESSPYYTVDLDLLKSSETACLHYITSIILSHLLCHLKGAYQAAFLSRNKGNRNDIKLWKVKIVLKQNI